MQNLTIPQISLTKGKWTALQPSHFFRATDGQQLGYENPVRLMWDERGLHVEFECKQDEFVANNYLYGHNEPLYNQAVFELFIAAGEGDPAQYLEFEINPNNAVWIGRISNAGLGESGGTSVEMVGHAESGVANSAERGHDWWSGSFSIPWSLIDGERHDRYRFNVYRIVATKPMKDPAWVCSPENAEFLCWSPTMSGEVPAFHRPKRFGHLLLK